MAVTETADESGNDAIAYLKRCVPTLQNDFGADRNDLLSESAPHSDVQAVIMAVMNIVPDLDRAAFQRSTTIADISAWIERGLAARGGDQGRVVGRPRGSYATASATLRPVTEQDVLPAYMSSLEPVSAHRWRFRGQTPSPEQFRSILFSPATFTQFAVVEVGRRDGPSIGLVYAYECELSNGTVRVAFQRFSAGRSGQADEGHTSSHGLMVDGLMIFIQYLFDHFTFRKIYIEVPEYNLSLFEYAGGEIFVKEGELRDHLYFGDRYWSEVIFALYRESWDRIADAFRGEWPEDHGHTFKVAGTPGH